MSGVVWPYRGWTLREGGILGWQAERGRIRLNHATEAGLVALIDGVLDPRPFSATKTPRGRRTRDVVTSETDLARGSTNHDSSEE